MQKKPIAKTKTNGSTAFDGQTVKTLPGRDEIARRAYEIYIARGRTEGREMDDWIQAERELAGKTHQHN
jgi:hypothetical protein